MRSITNQIHSAAAPRRVRIFEYLYLEVESFTNMYSINYLSEKGTYYFYSLNYFRLSRIL